MNNYSDILFIFPRTGWADSEMAIAENDAPPLGLLYIVESAREFGFNVSVVDMNHPPISSTTLINIISQINPRIVAFSVLSPSVSQVKNLSKQIKATFPNIIIIAGGIHPTVSPEDMLTSCVDIAVLGEGERTMIKLASGILNEKSIYDIPGIAFYPKGINSKLNNETLIRTSKSIYIHNLDELSFPARDLVPILEYGQSGAICGSRGCPHSCSFCSSVLTPGHKYRKRSVQNVSFELDQMTEKFGINRFQFVDDNFACDVKHAINLCNILEKKNCIWSCQTSIMELQNNINLLDVMFESGCREIYFGVESGSKRILKKYKGIDLDVAFSIIEYCSQIFEDKLTRLQIVVGFIIGHPEDDEQSIEDTIKVAVKLRSLGVDTMLSILQPYPGSLIFNNPGHFNIKIENYNFRDYLYPKSNISTWYLTRHQIKNLYASALFRIMKTYQ